MRDAGRGLAVTAAAAAALLLASCGGSSGDEGDGGAPAAETPSTGPATTAPPNADAGLDPCTLLTEDEVAAVADAEVTGVEGPQDALEGTTCRWSFPATLIGEVVVSTWVGAEFYSPDVVSEGWEEVPGVGDRAHRGVGGQQAVCTAIFRQGDDVVQVISSGAGEDACVELARTAAGRV